MKQTHFIVVCALVVVAVTLAVTGTLDESDPSAKGAVAYKSLVTAKGPSRFQPRPLKSSEDSRGIARSVSFEVQPGEESAAGLTGSTDSADVRAKRVEAHARERLERLNQSLQLSSDQQRRIFPILARSAPDFDPSMIVGRVPAGLAPMNSYGGPDEAPQPSGPDESAAIYQELSPDQQALYEESLIDEELWWAEILVQIENELDKATPAAVSEPPVMDDPGADENLFDLLGK